jgi:predicted ATPase
LERSALIEAIAQLTHALDQISTLPATPARRRDEINFQVALITPLMHIKGQTAPETKTAEERARLLIEQAEALGEPPQDQMLLFSVLYGFWVANYTAFNGDVLRDLAAQTLTLAEKQGLTGPLLIGHRVMGASLLATGDIAEGRKHLDRALALYDPAEHRRLATRFGQDLRVPILCQRAIALWMLGYPNGALADAEHALKDAREVGQSATLMYALSWTSETQILSGNNATANALLDELATLVDETGAGLWKPLRMIHQGFLLLLTGQAADALQMITSGLDAWRSIGASGQSRFLVYLAQANAELGQFDDAWRCISEALTGIDTTKERWFEADLNRIAGEVMRRSPESDATKVEAYFERALAIARQQQAKSWELRAAMSMARLWRDQGKQDEARDLLAPIYGWFTEGFNTLDLKQAKALLDELHA